MAVEKGKKNKEKGLVQSMNSKVDLVVMGTSFLGINSYGKIMIGDKAFEYYNDRDVHDYIQIPWEEVNMVVASVYMGGRYIPRFALKTKGSGDFAFATKEPKKVLKAINAYIPGDRMRRSLTVWQVLRNRIRNLGKKK